MSFGSITEDFGSFSLNSSVVIVFEYNTVTTYQIICYICLLHNKLRHSEFSLFVIHLLFSE